MLLTMLCVVSLVCSSPTNKKTKKKFLMKYANSANIKSEVKEANIKAEKI